MVVSHQDLCSFLPLFSASLTMWNRQGGSRARLAQWTLCAPTWESRSMYKKQLQNEAANFCFSNPTHFQLYSFLLHRSDFTALFLLTECALFFFSAVVLNRPLHLLSPCTLSNGLRVADPQRRAINQFPPISGHGKWATKLSNCF